MGRGDGLAVQFHRMTRNAWPAGGAGHLLGGAGGSILV
jgi:hypothetical protein